MGQWRDMFNSAMMALTVKDLHYAVSTGKNDYVLNLLTQYPDVINRIDGGTGMNALMMAVVEGPVGTMKLLLDKGASIKGLSKGGLNVLHMSIISGKKDKTALLLQSNDIGSIINQKDPKEGITPLMDAASIPEAADVVQRLLERGADPAIKDHKGRTALMIAQQKGLSDTVALLERWIGIEKPKRGPRNFKF